MSRIRSIHPALWTDEHFVMLSPLARLFFLGILTEQIGQAPEPGLPLDKWDSGYGFRVIMWRKGQEGGYVGEFTVGDARRAGLWENHKKKPWICYPKDMLFNRARAKPLRAGFADALHGMGIVEEERDVAPEIEHKIDTAALLSDEPEEAEIEEVSDAN